MKKIILFLLIQFSVEAQVVGTPYIIPIDNRLIDRVSLKPSFAFSTRKLREMYTGPAVRLRRVTDNSQVDVAFDSNGVVSGNSIVTLVDAGTTGVALGTTATLSAYRGSTTLCVTIWYDQGLNGFNGIQTTTSRQPVFNINIVGPSNQYASAVFTGTQKHNVIVNQTLPVLLGSGLRGSVMMLARVLPGVASNNSFGYSDIAANGKRWSAHMNWPSDNLLMYTDLGNAADANRTFINNTTVGLNAFKQYTLVRSTTNKIVRVSGIDRNNSIQNTQVVTWSNGSTFGVGLTAGSLDTVFNQNGITGNIPEFILYPEPLTTQQISLIENDQISFWGAN